MTGIEKVLKAAASDGEGRTPPIAARPELAARLRVSTQAVHKWIGQGWLPLERARECKVLYGVPLRELVKPDIAAAMEADRA
ncbi:MAG TPA: helix-turn-helix domain-containing protein [Sphingomonas sp.]|jgi:hypothetical protein